MDIRTEMYLKKAYDLIQLAIDNDKFENDLSEWDKKLLHEAMYNILKTF
ncbi:hypothetical protein AAXE64_08245 [Priestia megaterium]